MLLRYLLTRHDLQTEIVTRCHAVVIRETYA
jgi:hypothetical protein